MRNTSLIERLRKNDPTLTKFSISTYSLPEAKSLFEALQNNTSLKSLSVECAADEDLTLLSNFLTTNCTLQSLGVTLPEIEREGYFCYSAEAARILSEALMANNTLTSLSVRGVEVEGAEFIAKALTENTSLQTIDIACECFEGEEHIAGAIKVNRNVRKVVVGPGNTRLTLDAITINPSLRSLEVRLLGREKSFIEELARIIARNTTLEELNLVELDPRHVKLIIDALKSNTSLKKVSLPFDGYFQGDFFSAADILNTNFKLLSELIASNANLTGLEISCKGKAVSSGSMCQIANALEKNTTLTSFSNLSNMGGESLNAKLSVEITRIKTYLARNQKLIPDPVDLQKGSPEPNRYRLLPAIQVQGQIPESVGRVIDKESETKVGLNH